MGELGLGGCRTELVDADDDAVAVRNAWTDLLWSSVDWISAGGRALQGAIHVKRPRWDR